MSQVVVQVGVGASRGVHVDGLHEATRVVQMMGVEPEVLEECGLGDVASLVRLARCGEHTVKYVCIEWTGTTHEIVGRLRWDPDKERWQSE